MRSLRSDDVSLIADIYAELGDGTPRRILDLLIDHPDERFESSALKERLGLADHAEVARAIVAIGAAFSKRGIARPWSEAQRGYLLTAEQATILARGREAIHPAS